MMIRYLIASGILMSIAITPALAQEHKDWCTDSHMAQMDAQIAKMTDPKMQKTAKMHLDQSKSAMKKNDLSGCVKYMKQAHKAMGM
jgi:hypothetical protein